MSVGGLGRVGGRPGELGTTEVVDGGELDALAFETLEALDHDRLEGDGTRIGADALARLQGVTRTVDDAVAAPSPEHVARALSAERAAAAFARVVRRGTRPGESREEQRMRALVARLLDLRHEAAAGMGKVSVG
jgi:hypothetical protein